MELNLYTDGSYPALPECALRQRPELDTGPEEDIEDCFKLKRRVHAMPVELFYHTKKLALDGKTSFILAPSIIPHCLTLNPFRSIKIVEMPMTKESELTPSLRRRFPGRFLPLIYQSAFPVCSLGSLQCLVTPTPCLACT